jgi:hypothetical protein
MDKIPNKLTKGSRYRVASRWDERSVKITEGEFHGHVMIGADTGLCLKVEENGATVYRIIPSLSTLCIDVLSVQQEEEEKKKETPQVSYG